MTDDIFRFITPDGYEMGTGLLMPTPESIKVAATYPVYGEEFYLDKADIEKLLKGDAYKTFRRMRSPWILNQGSLGSCNAQATVNAFHNRRSLDGMAHVPLSPNYLYLKINGGSDSGSLLTDGLAWSKKGIAPRKIKVNGNDYVIPGNVFNARQLSAATMKAADEAAGSFVSWEAYALPAGDYSTFKIALASALARDHQVIHAWHVGNASMNLRNGYVQQGRGPGNHATLFHSAKWVGGDDIVHPDSENSWGPSKDAMYGGSGGGWGDDGFGLFTMADAYQCARNHQFWVYTGSKIAGAK